MSPSPAESSAPRGPRLLALALPLLSLDVGLFWLSRDAAFTDYVYRHNVYRFYYPSLADALRLAVPLLVLAWLIRDGWLARGDVGLTLGEPRRTLRWTLLPGAVSLAGGLSLAILGVAVVRLTGRQVPIEPTEIHAPAMAWLCLWQGCVMAPLVEELLYRGVLVPALAWLGGLPLALFGSGLVFVGLHLLYGRPAVAAPYYFAVAVVLAWAFVRSGSLLPPLLLHAAGNLLVLGKDLVLLHYPELPRAILGHAGG